MRGEDVSLLLCEELADREGEVLVESVGVSFLSLVFALLRGLEEGVVSAAQIGFQITPDTVEGAGCGSGFFDVVYAVLVKNFLEVAAEAGAFEGLCQEVALEGVLFQMLSDVGETFLAVEEGADEGVKSSLHFVLLT
jgi:hypothetical protein